MNFQLTCCITVKIIQQMVGTIFRRVVQSCITMGVVVRDVQNGALESPRSTALITFSSTRKWQYLTLSPNTFVNLTFNSFFLT